MNITWASFNTWRMVNVSFHFEVSCRHSNHGTPVIISTRFSTKIYNFMQNIESKRQEKLSIHCLGGMELCENTILGLCSCTFQRTSYKFEMYLLEIECSIKWIKFSIYVFLPSHIDPLSPGILAPISKSEPSRSGTASTS